VNFTGSTSYITQQLTATVAGLAGQVTTMGAALTVGFVALVIWLMRGGHADKVRIAVLASVPVFFWFLLAIVRGQDNEFGAPRYVAFGALPLALILLEAVRAQPRSRVFKYVTLGTVAFCVLANFNQLEVAGGDFRYLSSLDLPTQTALQLAANYVPADLNPSPGLASSLVAGPYLKTIRVFGSNAPSPAQLAQEPDAARAMADAVLLEAGAIHFVTGSGALGCSAPRSAAVVPVPVGTSLTVRVLAGPTVMSARRFADEDPSRPLDTVSSSTVVVAETRPDAHNFSSPVPWTFSLTGGRFEICT